MVKTPVFVGIDPGTTSAYAILDVEGNLVEVYSSKELGLSELISLVIKKGLPIVVGTDKTKLPDLIERFAAKVGCKIVVPPYDLKANEKKELANGKRFKDTHQMDSLASAIYAYKKHVGTIKKINKYVDENSKKNMANEIITYVIREGLSIQQAVALLEGKDEETRTVRNVIEERVLGKKDFIRLYERMQVFKKDNVLLRRYTRELRNKVRKLDGEVSLLNKKKRKVLDSKKVDVLFRFKEKRIEELGRKLDEKDRKIKDREEEIKDASLFISKTNGNYLLKKLRNLGLDEFEKKKKLLNVSKGDVLFVDDPNIYNNKVVESLKDKVSTIIYANVLNKKTSLELAFNFISSEDLILREFGDFALVKKDILDKKLQGKSILNKIIEDYKKSRR